MEAIKVVLIDDHSMVRNGIKASLEDYEDIVVVGEGKDGFEAIRCVRQYRPDVAIVDITMPQKNGIEAVKEIVSEFPDTKCLMLSMHDNQDYIMDSLEAGAMGYLLKDTDSDEFAQAIKVVASGKKYFSTDVSSIMADGYLQKLKAKPSPDRIKTESQLSKREKEILTFIVNGLNSKDIADKLNLSVRTIEVHRFNMMKKLNVKNVIELVRIAMSNNLV